MKSICTSLLCLLSVVLCAQQTEIRYLSGTGLGHTVTWDFYCSDGRNSDMWNTIEVPSQWELQGYGEYTYGRWYKEPGVTAPAMEAGRYRYVFSVPEEWEGRKTEIVFDGVMTDTRVWINGAEAGEVHQGGFYRFSYDITPLLRYGASNQLEVEVCKHSANKYVNAAERKADWWLFGGIYRPVWLRILPPVHIERVAADAAADGRLTAWLHLSGVTCGYTLTTTLFPEDRKREEHFPPQHYTFTDTCRRQQVVTQWTGVRPWTPESPHLYRVRWELADEQGQVLHIHEEKIGFRTVEFRPRDGIYVNGTKIVMKGVNRHSFHPDGGRTTNKQVSIEDVKLMKEMNMNAVRFHYPPDTHFLEACDSMGIFVINELAGWQNSYDTETGSRLLREMVSRDVNHPSIILWSNGNEGGWNTALDTLFHACDPQKRHVIHPWADFNGLDTHHYPAFLTGVGRFTNGYKVFMPTEFMHGQYDQGHGAGLEDFWERYTAHPLFAGGFLWDFSDNAVRRTDKGGILDSERFNAPDGILGPYHEKEASYYTVRDIWSPIQIRPFYITPSFRGEIFVTNDWLYTPLKECRMEYRLYRCPSPLLGGERETIGSGTIPMPALYPGETGRVQMPLPENFMQADVLEIEGYDPDGHSVFLRSYPVRYADEYLERQRKGLAVKGEVPRIIRTDSLITLQNKHTAVSFRCSDGTIQRITRDGGRTEIPFTDGPVAVGMKMRIREITAREEADRAVLCVRYTGGVDSIVWTLNKEGLLDMDAVLLNRASGGSGFDDAFMDEEVYHLGLTFSYPEEWCAGIRWMGRGPYRVWKNRIRGMNYGIWQKDYNNTITGESFESLIYPEFKGYHTNLYWATLESDQAPFTVYSATDGLYFRVFTPQEPAGRQEGINTMPDFPEGDLSFLLDIPAIRCFKPISQHGPRSQPGNIRIKKGDEGLRIHLVFDFR